MGKNNGLDSLNAAFKRVQAVPRQSMTAILARSANRIADAQRHLAETSRNTGALIDSITVTLPNQATPPYSQPSGSRVAGENEVIITAGNSDVRYAHLIEFGTVHAEAQSFFWPAFRLMRRVEQPKIDRSAKRLLKKGWSNKPQAGGASDD